MAGIGQYVRRLIEALLPLLADHESLWTFDGLSSRKVDAADANALGGFDALDSGKSRSARALAHNAYIFMQRFDAPRHLARNLKLRRFKVLSGGYDLFHAVNFVPPGPIAKPVLPLIYDLSHLRFPGTHPRERVEWLEQRLPSVLDQPFIQTISEFSKSEIVELLNIRPERIHVTHPGVAAHFNARNAATDPTHLARVGLSPGRYFLVVATRERRKNVRTVAEAFAALPQPIRTEVPLLWVGRSGWDQLDLPAATARAIEEKQIRMSGNLSDDALAALYRHAALFLMPSVYEGFGMPVAEALACGAPVAVSDIPVFREAAGGFARYIDPLDVAGWRQAMLDALEMPRPDASRQAQVADWVGQFSWRANALSTLALYRRLAGQ